MKSIAIKKSAPPHLHDISLDLDGFHPVVESSMNGSGMIRLPESTLRFPGKLHRRSGLILGLPGSGKTTRLLERAVVAALRHPEASVVVFAVQPGSARHAWAAHEILRPHDAAQRAHFNAGDSAACTHFFNPIAGVRERSQAMAIAKTLVQSSRTADGSGDGEYFRQQAATMIGHAILAVNRVHSGRGHLGLIRDAIDGGLKSLRRLGEKGNASGLVDFADEAINGNKNAETTLSEMSNTLQWLFDEEARTATATQELDLDALLLTRPGLLVLAVHEEKIPAQRPLTSLLFRNLFSWIIQRARAHGGALPRPVLFIIDELPAAGRIPDFGIRLTATFRKSNVSVFAAAQCEAQLVEVYGEQTAGVLAGFGSRIYVPPVDFADAERACQQSGYIEVANHVDTAAGLIISTSLMTRPLLLPAEIAAPPPHPVLGPRMLFRLADLPPFFGHLRASWETPGEIEINERAARLSMPRRRPSLATSVSAIPGEIRREISDTHGWSKERINQRYKEVLALLGLAEAAPGVARWWKKLENENRSQPATLLRLAEELAIREATIMDFYHSYGHSNTDNIQANLHYLDYFRLKNEE